MFSTPGVSNTTLSSSSSGAQVIVSKSVQSTLYLLNVVMVKQWVVLKIQRYTPRMFKHLIWHWSWIASIWKNHSKFWTVLSIISVDSDTSMGPGLQFFSFQLLPSTFPLLAGSLFENEWSLKAEYKRGSNRLELADRLASRILWIGIANLLLCPVILVWQILYAFFSYTEVSYF